MHHERKVRRTQSLNKLKKYIVLLKSKYTVFVKKKKKISENFIIEPVDLYTVTSLTAGRFGNPPRGSICN